jgi:KaiC/GvpD/RAD55 family RecA-like ATPase
VDLNLVMTDALDIVEIQGAAEGEKCLYLSMHETKGELVSAMEGFDFGFKRAVESGRIKFLNVLSEGSEDLLATGANGSFRAGVQSMSTRLVSFVSKHDIDRLVIDSAMMLRYFYDDVENAFIQFVTSLKRADTTTLLVSEMTDPSSYTDEHYLAHGVVFLHNYLEEGSMHRGIQTLKMRGTNIDADIREVEFTPEGLTVRPDRKLEV